MERIKTNPTNFLRFIAFLMIFLLHAKLFSPVNWNTSVVLPWLTYTPAWAGAWIFFILSGYGIGYGFINGKYKCDFSGVIHFYNSRLQKIVPLYLIYVIIVIFFMTPELLYLNSQSIMKLIKILTFNYNGSFNNLEMGAAWYLSTLMQLYFVAPLFFIIFRKLLASKKFRIIIFTLLIIGSVGLRISVALNIYRTGSGSWSEDIYVPFYMNLDFFFCGFLLNYCKRCKIKYSIIKVIKYFILSIFIIFILFNSYIYYVGSYFQNNNFIWTYQYIFPAIYILLTCCIIYLFDIQANLKETNNVSIKTKLSCIFDYWSLIALPAYLFHSDIFYKLSGIINNNTSQVLIDILKRFGIDITWVGIDFITMLIITLYGFILTVIVSVIFYKITKNVHFVIFDKIEYAILYLYEYIRKKFVLS